MKKDCSNFLCEAYIHLIKTSNQLNQMPCTNKVKKARTEIYLAEEALSKEIRTRTLTEEQEVEIKKHKETK